MNSDLNCPYPLRIAENVWMLGNYYFNVYFVKGSRSCALVEAGVSATVDIVLQQLQILNAYPDYLIITHPHADHVTGLEGLISEFPEALIIIGDGAIDFLNHPKAISAMYKEDMVINTSLNNLGIHSQRPPIKNPLLIPNHLIIESKSKIDLGEITLVISTVEGHCPGNVIVFIPELKILFLSDCMGFYYPGRGFLPLYLTSFEKYMLTLDMMESYEPQLLCLAHQGILADVHNAFRLCRKTSMNFLYRASDESRNMKDLANEIFLECYKDEFTIYSEDNIRTVSELLVRRAREYGTNRSSV